jgi:tRNA pseudouridine55 synthase
MWSWAGFRLYGKVDSVLRGLLNLNKPVGMTSRAVVDRVARFVPKRKAGHAGTLDPLASGVLVVCAGVATRLVESVQRLPKTYRTVIRLGARSDTLDADGQIEEVLDAPIPEEAAIRRAIAGQVGEIRQLPPEFSALKVNGQRAYDLARAGQAVQLEPRLVRIDRVELLSYEWPRLALEVDCGSGTYIRSIARDVGEALGCGGLIEVLTRTRIGPFTLADAIDPEDVTRESISSLIRPMKDALPDMLELTLSEDQVANILLGRSLSLADFAIPELGRSDGEAALLRPDGELLAIARIQLEKGLVAPFKVFP